MVKKTLKQKEVVNNLEKLYLSREEVIILFRDYGKIVLDAAYKSKENETKGKGLKILTPKQMLQRLPIALAQVKAGNNSESLLKCYLMLITIQNKMKLRENDLKYEHLDKCFKDYQ